MNTTNDLFTEPHATTIWNRYCDQVLHASRPLSEHDSQALLLEIKDHLYSNFEQQKGSNEVTRLQVAIEQMGNPDEFIRPLVTDLLFADAARTLNPRTAFSGLVLHLSRGLKAVIVSSLFGVGYLLSVAFLLVAVLKPFSPDTVGLFANAGGSFTLGILDAVPKGSTELLGYWVIPLSLALAILLYVVLTKGLRVLRTNKKELKSGP